MSKDTASSHKSGVDEKFKITSDRRENLGAEDVTELILTIKFAESRTKDRRTLSVTISVRPFDNRRSLRGTSPGGSGGSVGAERIKAFAIRPVRAELHDTVAIHPNGSQVNTFWSTGHIVFVGSPTPPASANVRLALGLLVLSIMVIGLGTGTIRINVPPMIAEYHTGKLRKHALPSGEFAILSPALTIQSIYT
ncbi:hypothetical protein EIP91_003637 [Steccherinum ochraceum]|uniref:Uncharacterized protein n=1 Tax=Steccherinum ochraceum TaxID=92696 RepID=A0A4V6N747_9APHY|nr:hypothetical protein EIP91_003637 [Steccherinum ochraceum]